MESSTSVENLAEKQFQFLELLKQLTHAGRVEWLQSVHEPGFIYCLVDGNDLIKFQCMGGEKGDKPVPPTQRLAGVVSQYCNMTYLWVNGLRNWELLMELLRLAKTDEEKFAECRRIAHDAPVRVLKSKLTT